MTGRDAAPRRQRQLFKVIAAAFIGTVVEWYDFFLYGSFSALVFNKLFFPRFDPWTGTMLSYGTYAAGFFFRPLGGVLFGYIGDRYGRKVALVWTLTLMGAATFLVGCLPTYETAGVWAPILLVVLRCAQGVAVGGEWG
ncbi:MAG TPA: MFS transporter, partial [Planctomycetota bacterium]|nr:MFS transporter [Planctomycetota bacterium]